MSKKEEISKFIEEKRKKDFEERKMCGTAQLWIEIFRKRDAERKRKNRKK